MDNVQWKMANSAAWLAFSIAHRPLSVIQLQKPRSQMRAVVQRVSSARVIVDGATVGEIGVGLLVLLGVTHTDTEAEARKLAEKIAVLRIFRDDEDKMN